MRLILLSLVLAACTNTPIPAPTEAKCPDPDPMTLTYDNFGQKFMTDYCIVCHDSMLSHAQRNGAPFAHDCDTLPGVLSIADHIDQYTGSGPASDNTQMPPSDCPSVMGGPLNRSCPRPTETERQNLAIWLACEHNRPH